MYALPDRCAGCSVLLAEKDNRYLSQLHGTQVFALCEPCGERIARLDPGTLEFAKLADRVLLAAATLQGSA